MDTSHRAGCDGGGAVSCGDVVAVLDTSDGTGERRVRIAIRSAGIGRSDGQRCRIDSQVTAAAGRLIVRVAGKAGSHGPRMRACPNCAEAGSERSHAGGVRHCATHRRAVE